MNYMTLTSLVLLLMLIFLLLFIIFKQVEDFSLQDDPKIIQLKELITPFLQQYSYNGKKGDVLLKKIKIYKGNKSYTINKEKIYLCLKDEKNQYYNTNMLMYVILHELAHSFCDSIGHTEEFNTIFQDLLEKANKYGIYNPSIPIDENYCNYSNEDTSNHIY